MLNQIRNKITDIIELTLHVGPGTFQPVKTEKILEHKMHSEFYNLSQLNYEKLKMYKKQHKRIL